jgi:hypothetical protein
MLHRGLIRQGYIFVKRRGAYVFCQHSLFHGSSRTQRHIGNSSSSTLKNPAQHRGSGRTSTLSNTQAEVVTKPVTQLNSNNGVEVPKIYREDVDEAAAAVFDEAGGNMEKFLEKAHSDGALEISPSQVKDLLGELSKFGHQLSALNLRNACASMFDNHNLCTMYLCPLYQNSVYPLMLHIRLHVYLSVHLALSTDFKAGRYYCKRLSSGLQKPLSTQSRQRRRRDN